MSLSILSHRHRSFSCALAGLAALASIAVTVRAADLGLATLDTSGRMTWSNAFPAGVVRIESASPVTGAWWVWSNCFTSNSLGGTNGTLITIAGNSPQTGGGEGFPALETSLTLPRSVWFIPNGGFFIGEHDPGNRIWYVDPAGIIHRWMNGSSANNFRVGDGQWFYNNPNIAKVSRVRSVNTDPVGNPIIVESNFGYVRRVRFQRLNP